MKASQPGKFEARIGGYMGWSFSATLTDKGVEYVEYAEKYAPMAAKLISPAPARWRALAKKLDELAVWDWKREYINKTMKDGTSWEFECEWGGRKISTGGSNAFPGDADHRKAATDPVNESNRFDRFLQAISELLGGEPFE